MGFFGKGREQQREELFAKSQQMYMDRMNEVMQPVIEQGKTITLPMFRYAHQQCAFVAGAPFGMGAPVWARIHPGEFKQLYWPQAWLTWSQYVVTEGHETWSYPNGKVNRWDGSRVIEDV